MARRFPRFKSGPNSGPLSPHSPNLPLHLERQSRETADEDTLYLAERAAYDVVGLEDRIAVQKIEVLELQRKDLPSFTEVLLEVHVELVPPGLEQRARLVQHNCLCVRARGARKEVRG